MQIDNYTVLISGSYNAFNDGWDGIGVYMCSGNYLSNTFKRPIYIGSSVNLQERIEVDHIGTLNRNKHPHNPALQFSWNKHNNENEGFIWFLLETCPPDQTLTIEQKYLDLYHPFVDEFGGFNILHYSSPESFGMKRTEEQKERMSKSQKGRKMPEHVKAKLLEANLGRLLSLERKQKLSKIFRGRKNNVTEEFINDLVERCSKEYLVTNPQGETFLIKNLSKFCRENGLECSNMCNIAKDKKHHKTCKGWKCSFP
jgi:group I intron endonuclease